MSQLSKNIFSKGTLFDLDIGRWGAIKRMTDDDMLLKGVDKNVLYLGHKKLLPRSATKKLSIVEGKARSYLVAHSVEFPIAGARFVTFKALPGVMKSLNYHKVAFFKAVDELLAEYPELKDRQIKQLNVQAESFAANEIAKVPMDKREVKSEELKSWVEQQAKNHKAYYPEVNKLKERYRFDWRVYKLSPLDAATEVDADALALFQEKYEQDIEMWAKNAATTMHKALGEAAAQAKAMLEKQGKLNPKNLKPLFQAFETFNSVDFTGKSSFQEVIANIKQKYNGVESAAEAINSTEEAKNEFANLLGAMGALALEETAEEAGVLALHESGFEGRVVDLV